VGKDGTYSLSDQSNSAGHIRNPVFSWLNPRSALTLRAIGGISGSPWGTIQSKIVLFRLFVSSDRALAAPFCNYQQGLVEDRTSHNCAGNLITQSAIIRISWSELAVTKRCSNPGTMLRSDRYTRYSRLSL
jgi:hypothetical protein